MEFGQLPRQQCFVAIGSPHGPLPAQQPPPGAALSPPHLSATQPPPPPPVASLPRPQPLPTPDELEAAGFDLLARHPMPHISPPSSMLNREQEPATGTEPSSAETTLGDSFAVLWQRMEERHAAADLQLPQKFDAVEASLIREIRHGSPVHRWRCATQFASWFASRRTVRCSRPLCRDSPSRDGAADRLPARYAATRRRFCDNVEAGAPACIVTPRL